jgi:hypothetical protein
MRDVWFDRAAWSLMGFIVGVFCTLAMVLIIGD